MIKRDDRVALVSDKTVPFLRGAVLTDPVNELVAVEWDAGTLSKVDVRKLILESDVPAAEQRLKDAQELKRKKLAELKAAKEVEKRRLEKEFEAARRQISERLKLASLSIEEAMELAKKYGKDIASDFYEEAAELQNTCSDIGWSSSWNC